MSRPLRVHLNRDGTHAVEPETSTVTTDGPFQIDFENHDQNCHVHLRPDADLAGIVSLEEVNPYVPAGQTAVQVDIEEGATGQGTLEISTGYGAASATVTIVCEDPREEPVAMPTATHESQRTTQEAPSRPLLLVAAVLGGVGLVGILVVDPTIGVFLATLLVGVALGLLTYHFSR